MTVQGEEGSLLSRGSQMRGPLFLLLKISQGVWGASPPLLSVQRKRTETIHAPNARNISRLMMCRWISDVPSQIRSTRASRQNRSNG